jgi:hypothetical protein
VATAGVSAARLGADAPDPGAAGTAVEGPARSGPGSVLRPGPRAGAPGRLRLQPPGRTGRDNPGAPLPAPDLPLRADRLELGARDAVLLRELRQPERGAAERPLGAGRGARAAPHRPHDDGGASRRQPGAVHGQVPGPAAALRGRGRGDQRGLRPRERGLRAGPSALQGSPRASPAAARQPGLRQPRGVLAARAGAGRTAERGAGRGRGGGSGPLAAVAGAAAGGAGAGAGQGESGQHDPGEEEHVLGAGAADRGGRRGAGRGRDDRGVVRGRARAADGTAARPGEAPRRLSAPQRLAGAEAGGLRTLRVPRGPVPHGGVPAGLRRAGGPAARACGPGVCAALAPGDRGGGGPGRGGTGGVAGGRAGADGADGAGALGRGHAVGAGGAGGRAGGGPAAVRRAPGRGAGRE